MAERVTNKKQWVIFSVLLVMIVLLASILFIHNTKKHEYSPEEEAQIVASIGEHIFSLTEEEAVSYLDEEATKYEGTDVEFDIRISKVYMFYNAGKYRRALEATESIDENKLEDDDKRDYYNILYLIHQNLGDEETSKYYYDLYMDLYKKKFGDSMEIENDV